MDGGKIAVTSTSTTTSSGNSSSSSTPTVVQTPQSEWAQQLSQTLAGIGQSQLGWAQQQFGQTAGVTDQQINNYLQQANYASNAGQNLWGRYQNTIEPLSNQYIQEAGSYASQPRQNFNAGQAESTAGQAADQNANAASQQLMDFGVNPSSGMYGELADASKAKRAASQASAGTQAAQQTQQTGRQMLQNAVTMGQQLPGASVNAMNAAYQGISGAENSALGLANTGVNLMDSANPYFSTAASANKLPSVGQTSNSFSTNHSQGNSSSYSPTSSGSGSGGDYGGSGGGGGGGGGGYIPNNGGAWGTYESGSSGGGGYSGGGGGGGYAKGGGVLPSNATSGGFVPHTASPSHGAETDDIPARLNADEFVIPRDVVHWKGSEFFQKLIDQSRKARGAPNPPAQGQMKPALPGPPRFISHRIAGGP